jgi:hypothetical protein
MRLIVQVRKNSNPVQDRGDPMATLAAGARSRVHQDFPDELFLGTTPMEVTNAR